MLFPYCGGERARPPLCRGISLACPCVCLHMWKEERLPSLFLIENTFLHLPLKSFICGKTTRGRCSPESSSATLSTSFKEGALFLSGVRQGLSLEAPGAGGAPTFPSRVEHSCGGAAREPRPFETVIFVIAQQTSLDNEIRDVFKSGD